MISAGHQKRIPQLDGLRACAIIAVFFSHAFKIRMLWIGVDLFFVLSGFLITGILLDLKHKDLKSYFSHFYERRIRRILPPYVLVLLVVSLIFGTAWAKHWYMYIGLTNYIKYFNENPDFMPFNPLWSLGVEEQFYLFWPIAVYFIKDRKLPYILVGLIILAPIFRVLAIPVDTGHWLVYEGTPFRMDCLAMGSLLTFAWRSRSQKIKQYGYLGLIPAALTPLVMMLLSKLGGFSTLDGTIQSNTLTYEIALSAATGTFLWALGGRYVGILTTSVFQFLGRISYSFYLIHLTAILLMEEHFRNRYVVASLAASLSILFATLSWYFVEKPILSGGRKRVANLELAAASPTQTDEELVATFE